MWDQRLPNHHRQLLWQRECERARRGGGRGAGSSEQKALEARASGPAI